MRAGTIVAIAAVSSRSFREVLCLIDQNHDRIDQGYDRIDQVSIDGLIDGNGTAISEAVVDGMIEEFYQEVFEDRGRNFMQESGKGKRKKKKSQKGFMERILPMMVMPFMISTSMIPMMLISLLGMLVKSAMLAKIGIFLMLFNMFRNRRDQGGVMSHHINLNRDQDVAMEHYGYHGDEEYGAYVNRRRRKR